MYTFVILLFFCLAPCGTSVASNSPGPDAVQGWGSPLRYNSPWGPLNSGFNSHACAADFDQDGDLDLLVHSSRGGGARNTFWGIHLYENKTDLQTGSPLRFSSPIRILKVNQPVMTYDWDTDDLPDILVEKKWYRNLGQFHFSEAVIIPRFPDHVIQIVDWNADSIPDLLTTDHLTDFYWPGKEVWQNGEPPYDQQGRWKGGKIRGTLRYWQGIQKEGNLTWIDCGRIQAGGAPLEVYGNPHPALADWDQDGDLDMIVGSHFDLFYFENTGTLSTPVLSKGRSIPTLQAFSSQSMYLRPAPFDGNHDSFPDLMIAHESGEISFFECLGMDPQKTPHFSKELVSLQENAFLDAGCLSTISVADWDNDGDPDVISGNSYGTVLLFLNPGSSGTSWSAKKMTDIHIQAGANGSIQGPAEAHFGYTSPVFCDWNRDGLMDIIVSDIWGKYTYYERKSDTKELKDPVPIQVRGENRDSYIPSWNWNPPHNNELITQWRCQPAVVDWDRDGRYDILSLDSKGYLALYRGIQEPPRPVVAPPIRCFLLPDKKPIRITNGLNGRSGRARVIVADWDGDGDRDILRGCTHAGDHEDPHYAVYERIAVWYENTGDDRTFRFQGSIMNTDAPISFCGHATSPAVVDWDGNGSLDLLLGAEDGLIYFFTREFLEGKKKP